MAEILNRFPRKTCGFHVCLCEAVDSLIVLYEQSNRSCCTTTVVVKKRLWSNFRGNYPDNFRGNFRDQHVLFGLLTIGIRFLAAITPAIWDTGIGKSIT